jgi:hypothetical protein
MDSGRGSFAIFSTLLKSLKVKVSGSCAARSRAVALSASRAVSTVSPKVTLIGVSPSSGSVDGPRDVVAWVPAGDGAVGSLEHAAAMVAARVSGSVSFQVDRCDRRVPSGRGMIM